MFLNAANATFDYNSANDYDGAIYALLKKSSIAINSSNVYFNYNTAGKIQASIYMRLSKSCNSDCLDHSIKGNLNVSEISASPFKLLLYSTVKCTKGNDTDLDCDTYYMNNVMLG